MFGLGILVIICFAIIGGLFLYLGITDNKNPFFLIISLANFCGLFAMASTLFNI